MHSSLQTANPHQPPFSGRGANSKTMNIEHINAAVENEKESAIAADLTQAITDLDYDLEESANLLRDEVKDDPDGYNFTLDDLETFIYKITSTWNPS